MAAFKVPTSLDVLLRWQAGIGDKGKAPIVVSYTGGVWVPPVGFFTRIFTATGGTKLTVDWSDDTYSLTNFALPVAPMMPYWNISRIYQAATDAIDLIAWPALMI